MSSEIRTFGEWVEKQPTTEYCFKSGMRLVPGHNDAFYFKPLVGCSTRTESFVAVPFMPEGAAFRIADWKVQTLHARACRDFEAVPFSLAEITRLGDYLFSKQKEPHCYFISGGKGDLPTGTRYLAGPPFPSLNHQEFTVHLLNDSLTPLKVSRRTFLPDRLDDPIGRIPLIKL